MDVLSESHQKVLINIQAGYHFFSEWLNSLLKGSLRVCVCVWRVCVDTYMCAYVYAHYCVSTILVMTRSLLIVCINTCVCVCVRERESETDTGL